MRTPEESCQRLVQRLSALTGRRFTFGYLGNDYGSDTSGRRYYAFAAHPGRVGTNRDRIGGVASPADLIPLLQGAVQAALVLSSDR